MNYIEFKEHLKDFSVFSYNDITKINPAFHRKRLVDWQKKGYIIKIRRGYYCFSDQPQGEAFLYYLSNYLYKPSYISLESAFSYYNLIPEGVFTINSVCTLKTTSFNSPLGNFEYKNIKPSLFFGYHLVNINNHTIRMAEPEKMILDYCYLVKPDNVSDFNSLRIDKTAIQKLIDIKKLDSYLTMYNSITMDKRIKIFKEYLNA
ncbi:MAG: hypothetical protein K8R41_12250 [Bacteroidales bacterium]|nr:hypothetical protein [Bacteroidales bacterium]